MNTDPQQIRARVAEALADLPPADPEVPADSPPADPETLDAEAADLDAYVRRLEEAHQILVDALESVEKG